MSASYGVELDFSVHQSLALNAYKLTCEPSSVPVMSLVPNLQDLPPYMRDMVERSLEDDAKHTPIKAVQHATARESRLETKIASLNDTVTSPVIVVTRTPVPPPIRQSAVAQCNGCHCLRPLDDFLHIHRIYKSCAKCRAKSESYYRENKDDVNANKYSSIEMFQCGCGSRVKMYSRRQHLKSERHRNWEQLPSQHRHEGRNAAERLEPHHEQT